MRGRAVGREPERMREAGGHEAREEGRERKREREMMMMMMIMLI